ncbi:MAG: DNA polymerase III subunit delta' [Deltaproteobacteria bacterium]
MFENIIGHEFQKNILLRAARDGVVSHAYLFSGPGGVGKRLLAIEFAKLLNCVGAGAEKGGLCECGACRKINKGIHPDVITVQFAGAKNIKVDQIREEVEEKLFLKPFEGTFKVVIVDDSERMNNSAQNAFLKTLEEPPSESVIILVTSHPNSLLPTIRSRCQSLGFNPLGEKLIVDVLEKRGELSSEEALLCSKLSGGSLGRALSLDKEIIEWRKELIVRLSALNKYSASDVADLTDTVSDGASSDDTGRLEMAFQFIYLWLRDLVILKTGSGEITNTDLSGIIAGTAGKWRLDDLLDRQRQLEKTWYDIFRTNANLKLALENLFIKLALSPSAL